MRSSKTPIVLALVALVAVAGCLGDGSDSDGRASEEPASASTAAAASTFANAPDATFRVERVDEHGGEPTIGVAEDGTIFVANWYSPFPYDGDNRLRRSTDHGRTWEVLGDPVTQPSAPLDPWMYLDPRSGRVFNMHITLAGCTWMAFSDDGGDTWTPNPLGGCGLPAHDHEKLTGGPPPPGVQTHDYPSVLYFAYNSVRPDAREVVHDQPTSPFEGTAVSVSLDGGLTWSSPAHVRPSDACHGGVNGPVAVAPDGTAYLPTASCETESVDVFQSRDAGETWEPVARVDEAPALPQLAVDPYVRADDEGNVYLAYPGEDGRSRLSVTADGGRTWSTPVPVSPPDVNATVFTNPRAGTDGRAAVAYLGTRADASQWTHDPAQAPPSTDWHLFVAFLENATSGEPTVRTVQVSPSDDPVQRGCINLKGTTGSGCQNLYDFIGTAAHEGRFYVAYTDGCEDCPEDEQSEANVPRVAILSQGPSLGGGTVEPLVDAADAEQAIPNPTG